MSNAEVDTIESLQKTIADMQAQYEVVCDQRDRLLDGRYGFVLVPRDLFTRMIASTSGTKAEKAEWRKYGED